MTDALAQQHQQQLSPPIPRRGLRAGMMRCHANTPGMYPIHYLPKQQGRQNRSGLINTPDGVAETASVKETCGAGIFQNESGRFDVGKRISPAAANSISSEFKSYPQREAQAGRWGDCCL
jgi:hypothetical protein